MLFYFIVYKILTLRVLRQNGVEKRCETGRNTAVDQQSPEFISRERVVQQSENNGLFAEAQEL